MQLRPILFFSLLAVLVAEPLGAQSLTPETVKQSLKTQFPEASQAIYEKTSTFTFHQASSAETPVTSKESVEMLLFFGSRATDAAYYTYTNTYSVVRRPSATYSDDRGKFRKSYANSNSFPYESGGIFHNDFFVNRITLPSSKGLYSLKYDKLYSDYKFLASVYFTESLPVLHREIVFEVPSWLEIEFLEKNFEGNEIVKTEEGRADGSRVIRYRWEHIPEEKDAPYSPSSNHYEPHILLLYKALKGNPLMPNTDYLYAWYRSLVDQLEEDREVYASLVETFKDIPKGSEQIYAVNNWVRDNVRYIAFESGVAGFKPDEGHKVYANRYGDCKGMANLCKNILTELGYDARLAWLGTRGSVPYDYSIPSLAVDNHMITAVKHEGDFVFLDPTETYGHPEQPAFRIQGRHVMIEDGDSYILTTIPDGEVGDAGIERNIAVRIYPEEGVRRMVISERYRGEPRKKIVADYTGMDATDREKALKGFLSKNLTGTIALSEISGLDGLSEDLTFEYELVTSDGVVFLDKEIYAEIDPVQDLRKVKRKSDRNAPWFFGERYHRKTRITYHFPDGYTLTYKPESFEVKHPHFTVRAHVEVSEQSVVIDREITVTQGEIPLDELVRWDTTMDQLKSFYEETLVFEVK